MKVLTTRVLTPLLILISTIATIGILYLSYNKYTDNLKLDIKLFSINCQYLDSQSGVFMSKGLPEFLPNGGMMFFPPGETPAILYRINNCYIREMEASQIANPQKLIPIPQPLYHHQ